MLNGLCRAGFETKQFIKFMCVHFEHIIIRDRICIEFRMDNFINMYIFISSPVAMLRSTGVY